MKHLSYVSSSIVFIVVVFALWKGYQAIEPNFVIIGWVVFGSVALFIPGLFAVKLWGIWYLEKKQAEEKKPVVRRKKVDGL